MDFLFYRILNVIKIKEYIYELIEHKEAKTIQSKIFHTVMITLIIINLFVTIMETVESFYDKYTYICDLIEYVTLYMFLVEYLLRIFCSGHREKYRGIKGKLKFLIKPTMIIDLVSILPIFLGVFTNDLVIIKVLRLLRIFRLFKLARYSSAFDIVVNVFSKKKEYVFISLLLIFFLLILSSSTMYFIEHEAQPEAFSSIPQAMWWTVVTMTTVGYGDVYPVTSLGKIVAGCIAILGIALFTLPAAILSAGFFEEIQIKDNKDVFCPFCGKNLNDHQKN